MEIEDCTRCDSKIVEEPFNRSPMMFSFTRVVDRDSNKYEEQTARFCSICWDELWEWTFNEGPDRSDKADPLPLNRMSDSVTEFIADLAGVLSELEAAKE